MPVYINNCEVNRDEENSRTNFLVVTSFYISDVLLREHPDVAGSIASANGVDRYDAVKAIKTLQEEAR